MNRHYNAKGQDFRLVSTALKERIERLVSDLGLGGRRSSGILTPLNPVRPDKAAGSFCIDLRSGKVGAWIDFSTGDKGDVIDLIAYVKRFGTVKDKEARKQALAWAKLWLGWREMPPEERKALEKQAQKSALEAKKKESEERTKRIRRGLEIFNKAKTPITGSVVEIYLRSRGIDLSLLRNPEKGEVRFAENLTHPSLIKRDGGQVVSWGDKLPAMVCAMRDANGNFMAAHVTYLNPDGKGKAAVLEKSQQKRVYGAPTGAMIRLTRGASNLTPEQAIQADVCEDLCVAEGIETALSLAVAAPEKRVWAAYSLNNLGNVPMSKAYINRLFVARDNDAGHEASPVFKKVMEKLVESRKPIVDLIPQVGKDFNDTLNA